MISDLEIAQRKKRERCSVIVTLRHYLGDVSAYNSLFRLFYLSEIFGAHYNFCIIIFSSFTRIFCFYGLMGVCVASRFGTLCFLLLRLYSLGHRGLGILLVHRRRV